MSTKRTRRKPEPLLKVSFRSIEVEFEDDKVTKLAVNGKPSPFRKLTLEDIMKSFAEGMAEAEADEET